ncbi:kinesin-like protein KIF11-B [Watersipora subatra]|uniref:kinesin-like protein KIF11-B n=1 Tax=Watersipora subatra TaxID=2589382 RepID=UPI00355BB61F
MPPAREKSTGNQHIFVAVRCRPMNGTELAERSWSIVETDNENKSVSVRERPQVGAPTKTFTFDKVFGTTSKQIDVYKSVVEPAIEEVIMGYNCTIFAYGQTGTGKTFTMEGERSAEHLRWEDDPMAGIVPRSLAHLFERLEAMDCEFSMRVSYLELYNEELFDLLGASECETKMRIYDDSNKKGSIVIQGLEEVVVRNKLEVYSILKKGSQKRQTASTMMNATSSRSHTVFTVTIHTKENAVDGEELVKTGKLNLVDLAGSENIGRSGAVDRRAREAGNINQSLLTLGRVITSLVDRQPHVPYRESKLTRILQDSLGGKTKTSIIATISPASSNLEETLSTLDYAHRAKNIQNKPEINQKLTKKNLIKEYNEEIERLRKDLQASRDKNGIFINEENYKEIQSQLASQASILKNQDELLADLRQQHDTLSEEHTATVEELESTKEELAETANKAEVMEKALERCQTRLSRTIQQRDEQMHIVEKHVASEKQLQKEAHGLLDSVQQTTGHIELLQGSTARKDDLARDNFSSLSEYRKTFRSHMTDISNRLQTFVSEQCEHLTSTSSKLGEMTDAAQNEAQKQESTVSSIQQHLKDYTDSLLERFATLHSETSATTQDVITSSQSTKENLRAMYEEIRNTCLVELQAKLADDQNAALSATCDIQKESLTQFAELQLTTAQFVRNMQECMDMFEADTKSFLESLADQQTSVMKLLSEQQQEATEEAEKIDETISSIVAALEKERILNRERLSRRHEFTSSYKACQQEVTKASDRFCERQTKTGSAINDHVTAFSDQIGSARENISGIIDERVSRCQEADAEMTKHRQELCTKVSTSMAQWQEEAEASVHSVSAVLRKFTTSVSTAFANAKDSTQTSLHDIEQKTESLSAETNAAKERLIGRAAEVKEIVSQQEAHMQQHKEQTEQAAASQLTDLNELVDTQTRHYNPTGSTPPKMEYQYVKEIQKPLVHKIILDAFRADKLNRDTETAANLALPLSDSEEEQGMSIADEKESVFNVSANAEEQAEDACSLDSVSMTDKMDAFNTKENQPESQTSVVSNVTARRKAGGAQRSRVPSSIPLSAKKGKIKDAGSSKQPSHTSTKLTKRKLPEQMPVQVKKQLKSTNKDI